MKFEKFENEINQRRGTAYHRAYHDIETDLFLTFASHAIFPNKEYLSFLHNIGFGSFFDGSLVLFSIDEIHETIATLQKINVIDVIPIGNDGTTSGCYLLENSADSLKVYWLDFGSKSKILMDDSFHDWIERTPEELFNKKIFSGFKKIKNLEEIEKIIIERSKFDVVLKSYDKKLVKTDEKQFLPRFHKVNFQILKREKSNLRFLTIKLKRTGSAIGDSNLEYLTIPVDDLMIGAKRDLDSYLFDPFNLQFDAIEMDASPNIDLKSKFRVRYKEIEPYL